LRNRRQRLEEGLDIIENETPGVFFRICRVGLRRNRIELHEQHIRQIANAPDLGILSVRRKERPVRGIPSFDEEFPAEELSGIFTVCHGDLLAYPFGKGGGIRTRKSSFPV
jgi:hypothetical protein